MTFEKSDYGGVEMPTNSQIPSAGPLSSLTQADCTEVSEYLYYGGTRHLCRSYRIPLQLLHFNIENGRYRTKYTVLKKANPGVNIDPQEDRWAQEILRLLNGTFVDPDTGVNTQRDRTHFEALKEDIRNRGQERPGIVLENGGVISGNRRLAALRTLYGEANEQRFGVFEAFIIPSGGPVSAADRWRLEMSAQVGQARLTRNYEPIERLLKIEEGIRLLMEQDPQVTEDSAVRAVANDFGDDPEPLLNDLISLRHIRDYLIAIGHPEEWWLAEGLTEVFLEIEPTMVAAVRQGMDVSEQGALKRQLFNIVKSGQATYDLIRTIRQAIGTGRRNPPIPSATRMLIDNAPYIEGLQTQQTQTDKEQVAQLVESFTGEVQARKDEQRPVTLAERAVTNLRALNDVVTRGIPDTAIKPQLIEKVREAEELTEQCLSSLSD